MIHNQHCSSSDYPVYIMDFYLLLPNTYCYKDLIESSQQVYEKFYSFIL